MSLMCIHFSFYSNCLHFSIIFLVDQVSKDKRLGYNAGNEFVGNNIQPDLHVWLATWYWIWGNRILQAAWDIFLYCLSGAVGQNFIFLTISRFGSLANTTITTTRKFVSIVVSSVLSGNPLSAKQWGCVGMVFSGLSYQIYLKWESCRNCKRRESLCD